MLNPVHPQTFAALAVCLLTTASARPARLFGFDLNEAVHEAAAQMQHPPRLLEHNAVTGATFVASRPRELSRHSIQTGILHVDPPQVASQHSHITESVSAPSLPDTAAPAARNPSRADGSDKEASVPATASGSTQAVGKYRDPRIKWVADERTRERRAMIKRKWRANNRDKASMLNANVSRTTDRTQKEALRQGATWVSHNGKRSWTADELKERRREANKRKKDRRKERAQNDPEYAAKCRAARAREAAARRARQVKARLRNTEERPAASESSPGK